jgi:hypothetical protein
MKNYSKPTMSWRAALRAQAQEKGGHATITLPVFHYLMPDFLIVIREKNVQSVSCRAAART